MSFIIILLISCLAPKRQPEGKVSIPHDEVVITHVTGKVSIPHDEVVITFVAE